MPATVSHSSPDRRTVSEQDLTVKISLGTIYMLFIDHSTQEELATVNALGQMMNSSLRSLAPVFATSLFAVSVENNILGGTLVYWICSAGVMVATWVSTRIPKSGDKRCEE